jgi:pyruvate, water dikinase
MRDDKLIPLGSRMDAQVYGGKAARLSEAWCASLPVPPGCVLHPDFVARVAQGNLTPDERTALEHSLAPFEEGAVAVRSSAIGEDGASASFAGQHATFLNVRGLDEILSAIATVWASGQTEAARRYRARMGMAGEPRVAVIVQELVPAEVAGVLFTVDPLSGSGDSFLVEASWGLGEAVVGGLVTPDRYVIARSGELLERHLGRKDVAMVSDVQGGTTEVAITDPARVQGACLDEQALVRLAALGAACERLFGAGQDIEWALSSGGTLYLLQCRPVTTGGRR